MSTPKVSYCYDNSIGDYEYSSGHPMKPLRVRMTHSLVMSYKLHSKMDIFRASPASSNEMTQFHTDGYIDFLSKVTPETVDYYPRQMAAHGLGSDSPVFHGIYDFCSLSAGGSIEGAAKLNLQKCDVAVNWAGGLHHAKKDMASGFCFVNDAVLGILELLRFHKRVLYVDIDVHHGDGVEEAFYTTDRVMCLSLHKFGEFFPGTGHLMDVGIGSGKYHSVNVPLSNGMDDESYEGIFEPVIDAVMKYYQPEAVVLQCGADSLSGDRLGPFNLSMKGHADCLSHIQKYGLPTMVLGGGGYTVKNVARTWAKETGILLRTDIDSVIPYNEYYAHFGPDFELDVKASTMANTNSRKYLKGILAKITDHLRDINHAPSVQMMEVPLGLAGDTEETESRLDDEDEDFYQDVRTTKRRLDKRIEHPNELMEGDDAPDVLESVYNLPPRAKRQKGQSERNRTYTNQEESEPSWKHGSQSLSAPESKEQDLEEFAKVNIEALDRKEGETILEAPYSSDADELEGGQDGCLVDRIS